MSTDTKGDILMALGGATLAALWWFVPPETLHPLGAWLFNHISLRGFEATLFGGMAVLGIVRIIRRRAKGEADA